MNPEAMEPFGKALLAYFEGDVDAGLIIRRDDGEETPLPVSHFFRQPSEFTTIDNAAIDLCKGHILDVGAGTGIHSLVLQRKGLPVTSIDISPQAVKIMRQRGLMDVHSGDILEFQGRCFDTILMMGHGIGMVETIDGLNRFLAHARNILSKDGQVLLDSLDVRSTDNPENLAYHETNRKAERYIGEIRLQFEFQSKKGPYCGWLHIDPGTLRKHADKMGWKCEVIIKDNGNYLARLS